jgi:NTE family protein
MKRGLVISGGGSKGAFAGGILEYLIQEKNYDWQTYVGTSTGSMLIPLASVSEIELLKEQFTNVNNKNIYNINPFNKRGSIRILNAIWRLITKKNSLGAAKNLFKLLKKHYTAAKFQKSIDLKKDVFVTVTNTTEFKAEYILQKNENYDRFCKFILASASIPLIFEVIKMDGKEYVDGGVLEPIPIQKALDEGCDEIDIIILSTEEQEINPPFKSMLDVALDTITLMNMEINKDDIQIGHLEGEKMNVKLNIYRTPYKLTDNSAMFNKKQMRKWWTEGYEFAKDQSPEKIQLTRTKTKRAYKTKKLK